MTLHKNWEIAYKKALKEIKKRNIFCKCGSRATVILIKSNGYELKCEECYNKIFRLEE